jgi:hypothetical protein
MVTPFLAFLRLAPRRRLMRDDGPGNCGSGALDEAIFRLFANKVSRECVHGEWGTIMATITLARTAENPHLVFRAAVERAVALSESRSPEDHDAILQILDRLADGSNMPQDHDRLMELVAKYRAPAQ